MSEFGDNTAREWMREQGYSLIRQAANVGMVEQAWQASHDAAVKACAEVAQPLLALAESLSAEDGECCICGHAGKLHFDDCGYAAAILELKASK